MEESHGHHAHATQEQATIPRVEHELTYYEKRVVTLMNLLREKGIITLDEVRRAVEEIEAQTPAIAARVVAKAWADPAFKARLLADAKAAVAELGISTDPINHLVALENTDSVHHVVVCTLCSCYPRPLMGQPPDWYKNDPYKKRVITDPRGALREFGLELDGGVEVRVVDSTADVRYLVLPKRPPKTEGMSEEELAELVTRDSMIGVGVALLPDQK